MLRKGYIMKLNFLDAISVEEHIGESSGEAIIPIALVVVAVVAAIVIVSIVKKNKKGASEKSEGNSK